MRKGRSSNMVHILIIIAAAFLLPISRGKAAPAPWLINENDLDYESITPEEELPRIISQGEEIQAEVGTTVLLPCDVVKLGKYSVVWQRGNKILWVLKGDARNLHIQAVIQDDRMENVNTSLLIRNLTLEYAGDYSCEIRSSNQLVQHKLVVQEPPSVKQRNGHFLSMIEDNPVELSCIATGVPTPVIRWEKDDIVIQIRDSPTFSIDSVKLSDEGVYACIADNGIGEAAKEEIALKVDYVPQVEAPNSVVYSGVGYNVDLFCIVKASPVATVQWFKNDDLSTPLGLKKGIEKGDRYYVSIQPVHLGDFGEYICHASNFWGNDSTIIELSGRPVRPVITNVHRGELRGQYKLTWEVESYSSIASYDVFYKEGTYDDGEWANVTVPGHYTSSMFYTQFYTLEDITPDVSLLVKIKARNEFGGSEWSDVSSFVAAVSDTNEKIKLVTRETSKMDPEDDFFQVTDAEEKNKIDLTSPTDDEDSANISVSFSARNDSNDKTDSSSSGFPNLTPAQKKAQMVALITVISLSSFFC